MMLDVHPPHAPTHSWKDFFIHVGTITVGLLIAVGLEQTVEYFHHRHQLRQLQEDLHAESLRNLHIAIANIEDCETRVATASAIYEEVIAANREHRRPVLHSALGGSAYVISARAVWTVALQNGTLDLLPRGDAQRYVRVYSLAQQATDVLALNNTAFDKLHAALEPGLAALSPEQRNLAPPAAGSAAWASLNPEDFHEARNSIPPIMEAFRYTISRNVFFYAIEWGTLNGSHSDEDNIRLIYDAIRVYTRGGKAALLAKYPLPKGEEMITTTEPVQPAK